MAAQGSMQDRADFQKAVEHREKGRRSEAVRACQAILARSPQFAPALHLMGFMALEDGELDIAARFLPAAVRADPSDASVHHTLGLLFRAGRKPADAAVAFRAAVRIDPRHLQALNGLGLSLLETGDTAGAEAAFTQALQAAPRHAETLHNRGLVYERQGRMAEAEQAFRSALEARPNLLPPRLALGRALLHRDLPQEAEPHLRGALDARPDWPEARAALAQALEALFRDAEAESLLRSAPDPRHPAIAVTLANRLARDRRFAEAVAAYDEVLARAPHDPIARHNRANALAGSGRVDEAIAEWQRVLSMTPDFADAHFSLSRWLLARGDYEAGWAEFAWRPVELPSWLPREGLSRADQPGAAERAAREKAIELVEEQGLGDVLFYLRWAPWLLERGWRVIVRVSPRLAPVVARIGRFELRQDTGAALGQDCVAMPVADLPRLVTMLRGGPLPDGALAIEPLPERLQAARQALAEAGPAPYTGLTWRAGVARRSVGRDMLSKQVDAALLWKSLDAPGTLVAMQRNPAPGELDELRRIAPCVADFSSWTEDLESLLGLLAALDGYAGVSNTNMHLLALLGRRATVAMPHPPEWRWGLDGESRWFPGSRVIRQRAGEGWSEAFAREAREG